MIMNHFLLLWGHALTFGRVPGSTWRWDVTLSRTLSQDPVSLLPVVFLSTSPVPPRHLWAGSNLELTTVPIFAPYCPGPEGLCNNMSC